MFFIMGISDGRKDFEYARMVICAGCGAYGRYRVVMTYTALSLFFIPIFKWNRKYYVESTCCGEVFALDGEIGARIARGEDIEILPEHLQSVRRGSRVRRCAGCGYTTGEDFDFCPKCGRKF